MVERGVAVVVEDDDDIRTTLTEVLQQSGFAVHSTASGVEGVDAVREHNPDIVTMDVGLPDFDGIEASRRIRTFSDAYLIIVSGRVDEADTLMGFEAGADDYLTKPFGMAELLARLRVVLRRARLGAPERLTAGDVTIDMERHLVFRGDREVHLTPTEFDLLRVLATEAGKVLTHRQILERVWGRYAAENSQQLRVYINYLRRKLEDDPSHPRLIVTDPGVGYRLKADPSPTDSSEL